jgi:hypothetical protein
LSSTQQKMVIEKKAAAPTVRLKTSLRKKLKKLPRQEGRSVANHLEQLIKHGIERWHWPADSPSAAAIPKRSKLAVPP